MNTESNVKIIVIDDNPAIHEDFKKIFIPAASQSGSALDATEKLLFEEPVVAETEADKAKSSFNITIDSAFQGDEGFNLIKKKLEEGIHYAIAFIDVRMPPGGDGIETAAKIWKIDPDIHIVICSAYSDYSWDDISAVLGETDQLLILKKPFDVIEARQIVTALLKKWELTKAIKQRIQRMNTAVEDKTAQLDSYLSLIKTTLEATTDGLVIYNKEGFLIDFNTTFLKLWNIDMAVLKESKFEKIAEYLSNQLINSADGKDIVSIENFGVEKDFSCRLSLRNGTVLECYSKPQYIKDKMIARVWCFHDITEYLSMRKTVVESEKMAAVGLLASGIAHELSQPLTIIKTSLQTFEFLPIAQMPEAEVKEIFLTVMQQIARASNIIKQMQDFSKHETTANVMINIPKSVEDILKEFKKNADDAIEIACNLTSDLPDFSMDTNQFKQMLMNILINSKYAVDKKAQAGKEGYKKKIDLSMKYDVGDKQIQLEIRDNGIGMTENVLAHCFDPFFTGKEVGEGTGLGLTIVYNIVKRLNGKIEIKSELNEGSVIKISLPMELPAET